MSLPKSITSVKKKNGKVEYSFTNNVDRANYTIKELSKAALRDVGKLLVKKMQGVVPVRTGKLKKALDKKVSKDSTTGEYVLRIGTRTKAAATESKPYIPYIHLVLFPHKDRAGNIVQGNNFIEDVTRDSVDEIREIEGKYLSAIEDENKALALIDNSEDNSEE